MIIAMSESEAYSHSRHNQAVISTPGIDFAKPIYYVSYYYLLYKTSVLLGSASNWYLECHGCRLRCVTVNST